MSALDPGPGYSAVLAIGDGTRGALLPGRAAFAVLALGCLYLVVLPAKSGLYNAASLASAAGGLVVVGTQWRWLVTAPAVRMGALVFLCLWLPMVLASADALDPARAWEKTGLYLRFALGMVFMLYLLSGDWGQRWVARILVAFYVFWTVDASVQALFGVDFLGYPYESGQLRGVFYPKYRLGVVLTVFLPLILDVVATRARRQPAWWLSLLPVLVVVVLTLHRNSWLMALVGVAAYSLYALVERGWRPGWRAAVLLLVGPVLALAMLALHDGSRGRFTATVDGLFAQGDRLDEALGQRPDIWRTAVAMFAADPIDGVGPRGFRGAYRDFAPADDYWRNLEPPQWPTHPHQLLLEILAETGLAGAFGLAAMLGLLGWRYTRLAPSARARAGPWLLCLFVAVCPLNVHKSFYGHFIASLVWWLLPICVAVLYPGGGPSSSGRPAAAAAGAGRVRGTA